MPTAKQLTHHELAKGEALDVVAAEHGRITIRALNGKGAQLVLQAPADVVVAREEPRRRLVLSRLQGQAIVMLLQDGRKVEFAVTSDARFEILAPKRVGIWRKEISAGKRPPASGEDHAA